mmetsp:Transcript_70561/g.124356  ORF Transcript_70561/g.124356 Transcript_70561/m.124356 type:complete len:109 (-) Transcript_70561:394-720(-)
MATAGYTSPLEGPCMSTKASQGMSSFVGHGLRHQRRLPLHHQLFCLPSVVLLICAVLIPLVELGAVAPAQAYAVSGPTHGASVVQMGTGGLRVNPAKWNVVTYGFKER